MSYFSSLLSEIGGPPKAPQQAPANTQNGKAALARTNSLIASNNAAGVKRRSEEPESRSRAKTAKTEHNVVSSRPTTAPSGRFQLSGKAGTTPKPSVPPLSQSASQSTTVPNISKLSVSKAATSTPTPPGTANGAPPAKRGYASIMERAKAAQEANKSAPPSGITHKKAEKLTKKDRLRKLQEAKEQEKLAKSGKLPPGDRSRSGTPVGGKAGLQKKGQETTYKGTMKKASEPLAYKGTMRANAPAAAKDNAKKKGQAQDKYGGYASWSDLDDVEDEEEDYDSEGSSDMEGGFDAVELEERAALRAAQKEDQEALAEEEAHRKEKLERKRKLEQLSKSAAARKKY